LLENSQTSNISLLKLGRLPLTHVILVTVKQLFDFGTQKSQAENRLSNWLVDVICQKNTLGFNVIGLSNLLYNMGPIVYGTDGIRLQLFYGMFS